MLAIVGSLLSRVASGVLAPLVGYFTSKDANLLAGFTAGVAADKDVALATINARVQLEQLKASQNSWWGARLIVLLAGGSASLHFAAVMLDSTFHFGWGVPKCPPPYDGYEWAVVQSFFILVPAMPIASAVTSWLHRA